MFDPFHGASPKALQSQMIHALQRTAAGLLLTPPVGKEKRAEIVQALDRHHGAWCDLVKATSTSNPGYEIRDLPDEDRAAHEHLQHILRILHTIYVPSLEG